MAAVTEGKWARDESAEWSDWERRRVEEEGYGSSSRKERVERVDGVGEDDLAKERRGGGRELDMVGECVRLSKANKHVRFG